MVVHVYLLTYSVSVLAFIRECLTTHMVTALTWGGGICTGSTNRTNQKVGTHTRDHGRANLDCGCLSLPNILRGLLNGVYLEGAGALTVKPVPLIACTD